VTAPLIDSAIAAAKLRHAQVPESVRRARGIVHTPSELACYGVGRIDALLREQLDCTTGLSDRKVCALDPALGTGVWLAAWLDRQAPVVAEGPELLGYDIDYASTEAARSLLCDLARQRGTRLTVSEGNTLGIEDPWGEARSESVRVILGNPPWGARSSSRGLALSDAWLSEFRCDGKGTSLGERRTGVLSDDYVRFFRWALEQARTAPRGCIVCLATNSSFLDGPVHRGMREALVKAFDYIEVLDLGGNALRGGARDENVFGVRVGTCLTIGVRRGSSSPERGPVGYAKLQGNLGQKLEWLASATCLDPQTLQPAAPNFLFVPQKGILQRPATETFSLAQAFPFHREGVQTNRDALVTAPTREALRARLEDLARGRLAFPERLRAQRAPVIDALRAALEADDAGVVVRLSYRPLDERYLFQLAPLCHRPRPELARAVAQSSVCLLSARKDRGDVAWNLFGVSRALTDGCYLSTRSSCRTRVFPSHDAHGAPNLDLDVAQQFLARTGRDLVVEDLVAYCLGLLSAESFRRDHDQALHQDYPVLPLPRDRLMFDSLRDAGRLWIRGWLDPIETIAGQATESVPTGDHESSGAPPVGQHRLLGVSPEAWAFCLGDFPVLPRLIAAGPAISPEAVWGAVSRVHMCVGAAALAEVAYRATLTVR